MTWLNKLHVSESKLESQHENILNMFPFTLMCEGLDLYSESLQIVTVNLCESVLVAEDRWRAAVMEVFDAVDSEAFILSAKRKWLKGAHRTVRLQNHQSYHYLWCKYIQDVHLMKEVAAAGIYLILHHVHLLKYPGAKIYLLIPPLTVKVTVFYFVFLVS